MNGRVIFLPSDPLGFGYIQVKMRWKIRKQTIAGVIEKPILSIKCNFVKLHFNEIPTLFNM